LDPPAFAEGRVIAIVAAIAACVGISRWRRRGRGRVAPVDPFAVADVVDLFALACGAGLTVASALRLVAAHTGGPLGQAFGDAVADVDDGARVSDVLADLPMRVGEVVRPLSSALAMAARYGTPVVPALERAAIEIRLAQRRTLEERARRLPVQLLFPLVFCCLPAFALLTVAPFVLTMLNNLTTST
jgi:pilus assembly protein TadC